MPELIPSTTPPINPMSDFTSGLEKLFTDGQNPSATPPTESAVPAPVVATSNPPSAEASPKEGDEANSPPPSKSPTRKHFRALEQAREAERAQYTAREIEFQKRIAELESKVGQNGKAVEGLTPPADEPGDPPALYEENLKLKAELELYNYANSPELTRKYATEKGAVLNFVKNSVGGLVPGVVEALEINDPVAREAKLLSLLEGKPMAVRGIIDAALQGLHQVELSRSLDLERGRATLQDRLQKQEEGRRLEASRAGQVFDQTVRKFAESIESLDTKKNPEARKVIDLAKSLYAKQDVTAAERAQASLYLALYDQVVNEYEGMATKYEEMSKELAKYKASFSPGSGTVGSYEAPAPRNANEALAIFQKGLEGVMAGAGQR